MMNINKRILRTITIIFAYTGLVGHTSADSDTAKARDDTAKARDDTAKARDDTAKARDDTAKVHVVNNTGGEAESTSLKFE